MPSFQLCRSTGQERQNWTDTSVNNFLFVMIKPKRWINNVFVTDRIWQPKLRRQSGWPCTAVHMWLICSNKKLHHKNTIFLLPGHSLSTVPTSQPTISFRWYIAHANSMCAHKVITVQNLCRAWVILMTTNFLHPKIQVSAWIFTNFSLLLKKGYLRQPFVKFAQQLNDYSENYLVLKLVDDFLASRYASLTTKSSHFVWSITLRNLNQFQ